MKKIIGELHEAKEFKKEIVYIRGYFISMKDEHGQVLYTFKDKKKADQFFKVLQSPPKDLYGEGGRRNKVL